MENLNSYQHIADLLYKEALYTLSDAERAELQEWLAAHNSEHLAELVHNYTFLQEEYQATKKVNTEQALHEMQERIESEKVEMRSEKSEVRGMRNFLKYAAAILILIVAGAGYWYSQYTKVTPPEIPEAVQLAMQQSIQSGKQEAESEELRVKSEESSESEELRVKSEESFGKTNSEDSPAKNFSHSFNNSSSLFTLHSSLNITSSLTKDQLLAAKRITTKHDKEFWLTLEDGTLVHLNYNTRLIYPEKFGRGDRNVILDGEAYFMVAKDKSRPFIVHTPQGDVKVYGTEFNVNTRTEVRGEHKQDKSLTATTTVVLVKGSVSVIPTGGKETMLKPGQQATVNGQWSTVNVENVDVEPYVAWNEGKFSFRNWQLERIMDVLSRWYGYSVEYRDSSIRQLTFSGNFNRYEKIRPTMDFISEVAGLKIEIKQNKIIIEK